jgi:hypothetical protein
MKRILLAATILSIFFALNGCGSHDTVYVTPVTYQAQIYSDPVYDGYINLASATSYIGTPSVFAGIDPVTANEFQAFLHFPLGQVPGNAIIVSAYIDIFISSINLPTGKLPILIELVGSETPIFYRDYFDDILFPPLQSITTAIYSRDVGRNVRLNVTALMEEAQYLRLPDFQIRILEDLGFVDPGLIEINDNEYPPLLTVNYY